DKISPETADDLVGLLAVTKRPREGAPVEAWNTAVALIQKKPSYAKTLESRHATATKERQAPPPAMKKSNFCLPSAPEDNGSEPTSSSRRPPGPKATAK